MIYISYTQFLLLCAEMLAIMAVALMVHAGPHLDVTVTLHVIPLLTVAVTSEI